MNIKNIIACSVLALAAAGIGSGFSAEAKSLKGVKIYINPGHGGYTSNDRPIHIYPFVANDSAGYWESKSNLYKGLHLYHILDSLGAKPYLSRTKNTEADDRDLSGIAAEANSLGCDLFFSIHSNAGENVNRPLMLYRENSIGTPRYPENVTISKLMWKNFHSSKLPVWTNDNEYVVGDLTFYQNMWSGGLGVLRTLYVVGLLSEGSMHEHRPEAYRLMNDDVWWLEAWHIAKSIMEFYDSDEKFVTGNVAGIVYDNHNLREKDMPVNFTVFGRDKYAPINGAYIELLDQSGNLVQKRTTDNIYNGAYVFRNVSPGKYTVRVSHGEYYTETADVTVTAMETTYNDFPMVMKREFPLAITAYSPSVVDGEAVSCASTIDLTFNTDVDVESFEKAFSITPAVDGYFKYSNSYHNVSFIPNLSLDKNTTYTVKVTKDAKTPDTKYSAPNLADEFQFSFTTRDRSNMTLIDRFPADGGSVHYVAPTFEFRFDAEIDAKNLYDMVKVTDSKGTAVSINQRSSTYNKLTNGYGNATLAISGNLTEGETYHVKLDQNLRDKEQLPLIENEEFDFVAVDASKGTEGSTIFNDFEMTGAQFAYDEENTTGIANVKPTATRTTSVKLFDKASAMFTYQYADNHDGSIVWKYTGESHNFNTDDVFSVFVNGDFNNHELWLGFTSGAATKYIKLCDLDFLGWQHKEVKLSELDHEFGPYTFSHVKLVQVTSPVTQKGKFYLDNMSYLTDESNGVSDVVADGNTLNVTTHNGTIYVTGASANDNVKIYSTEGRMLVSTFGNATVNVPAGVYVVTVGDMTTKVNVR